MKLNLEQIKSITSGAARITEENDGFHFFRFTKEQEELYKVRSEDFYIKTFCTSGVKFSFYTDSDFLKLKVNTVSTPGCHRRFFSFDVFVNEEKIGSINNYNDYEGNTAKFLNVPLPEGDFEKEFSLGEGKKKVDVYLPWSARATVKEVSIEDNALLEPIKPQKTLLCFGDSITQGYDALSPSAKYTTRLANYLNAQEFNKAIGGECFLSELGNTKEDFIPDYILVAYGTNDFTVCPYDTARENIAGFYGNLAKNYPTSKIYALTPIWRKDHEQNGAFGEFHHMEETIRELTAKFSNITVVRGFELVPHEEKYFGDFVLHPNNEGFEKYFESLTEYIK
ncbi:MAG: SGNH/GDSL hydrolase family protein [Clostridia bacterium]|nr:SGNH/GDSL hydrolase family protein [Clostridia bacterium]